MGLVVERDVARNDGEIQRAAGLGHALDALGELGHDLRPLGIAEIHAVGQRQRLRARGGEIAPGLGHGLLAAFERIGGAIAGRDIAGERERLARAVDANHRGVGAGAHHRVAHHHVVVLFPNPALGGEVGRAHQRKQRVREAVRGGNAIRAHRARASAAARWGGRKPALRRTASRWAGRPRRGLDAGSPAGRCPSCAR